MKNRRLGVAACASLLLFASAVLSRESGRQETARALPFTELRLELSSPKAEYVQFEPIPITLKVSNPTRQPVISHDGLNFSLPYLELHAVERDGGRRDVKHTNDHILHGLTPTVIPAGETRGGTQLLTLGLDRAFPRPGRYALQAVLSNLNPDEKIASNLLTVEIKEPRGEDAEALEFIRARANASNFFTSVYASRPETVEEFASKYADSTYGDHAVFMLGAYYFYQEDYERALAEFVKLAGRKDFARARAVSWHIEEIRGKLGRGPGSARPSSPR